MVPENANPYTSSQSESLIGSSSFRPTPVDSTPLRVVMCPTRLPGDYEQTPALLHSLRPQNRHDKPRLSIFFTNPRPVTTQVRSPPSRNLFQISELPPQPQAPYGIVGEQAQR